MKIMKRSYFSLNLYDVYEVLDFYYVYRDYCETITDINNFVKVRKEI